MPRSRRRRAVATVRAWAVLLGWLPIWWLTAASSLAALDLPDIAADAARYRDKVTSAIDAGEGVAIRLYAAKQALEARRWLPAIKALEALLLRQPDDAETWLRLARAWREQDSKAAELSAAAYNSYLAARRTAPPDEGAQSEALLLIAQQLERQHRRELAIRTWAEVGRLVSDPALEQRLVQQSAAAAEFQMQTEPPPKLRADAQAPSWCAEFTAPLDAVQPSRYREWVRAKLITDAREDPATVEPMVAGSTLCLYGFHHGEHYQLTLKRDLAAADGRKLSDDINLEITVDDRPSDLAFKSDSLILPANSGGNVSLKSVNVPKQQATLVLVHVTDRQLINEVALGHVKSSLKIDDLNALVQRAGRLVWWGSVDLGGEHNKEVTTALPVGDILHARTSWHPGVIGQYAAGFVEDGDPKDFGPGVYALVAFAGRCTDNPLKMASSETGLAPCLAFEPNAPDWRPPPGEMKLATQWIVYTDLGLQLLRGSHGLHVVVRSLTTGMPQPARVQLVATANRVLAEAAADADGLVRFDPGLARGVLGNRLQGVFAFSPGGDFAFLDATSDTFDLSDRGVAGRAAPGPVDAFVWTDRGIYRPGEAVQAMVMLRNDRAMAVDPPPLRVRLVAPDETAPVEVTVAQFEAGVAHIPLNLPRGAAAGAWRVETRAGESLLGAAALQVRAFVPNRIELQIAGLDNVVLEPGKPLPIELQARYLYGAPAAGLGGVYRILLRRADHPFPGFEAFQFGSQGDAVQEVGPIRSLQRTSNDGSTQVEVMLDNAKAPFPVEALLRVQVNDTDGGSVGREFSVKVRAPEQRWIGARSLEPSTSTEAATVEVVAVDGDGRRVADSHVRWELYAEEEAFQWERQRDADRYAYEVSTSARLLRNGTLDIAAGEPARLLVDEPLGRYRVILSDDRGTVTRLSFTHGFEGGKRSPGRPDLVKVTLDKPDAEYQPGDVMTVRVTAAFPGELMLLIAGDSVHKTVNQHIGAEPAIVRLPVEGGWGPRPYVLATVFRSGAAGGSPGPSRAVGAAGFAVRQAGSILQVTIDAAPVTPPRRRMPVNLSVTGLRPSARAFIALAAVDAGILSLTDYAPPDPQAYFLGQRRLALELLDNYGRLITGEGAAAPIRSGGDALGPLRGLKYDWPAVVAQFSGIVPLDAQGRASLEVDLPDFLGRIELMAVAWTADQAGSNHASVRVRDPIVARPDLPHFMAPGDKSTLAVELRNEDAGAGEYEVTIGSEGPIRLDGEQTRRFRLMKQEGARMELGITAEPLAAARDLGVARVELRLHGIDNTLIDIPHQWDLPVRPVVQAVTKVARTTLAPRQTLTLTTDVIRALAQELSPVTVKIRRRVATLPQLGPGLFDDEIARPALAADELAGRTALLAAAVVEAGGWDQVAARLRDAFSRTVTDLVALQRSDGSFRAYPGPQSAAPEGDGEKSGLTRAAYIADVLSAAAQQGLPVPSRSIAGAGDYLLRSLGDPECTGSFTYPVYVLVRLARAPHGDVDELRHTCSETAEMRDAAGPVFAAAALVEFGYAAEGEARAQKIAASFDIASDHPLTEVANVVYGLAGAHLATPAMHQILDAAAQRSTGQAAWVGLETRGRLALAAGQAARVDTGGAEARIDGEVRPIQAQGWRSADTPFGDIDHPFQVENLGSRPLVHELIVRGVPLAAPSPGPKDGVLLRRSLYRLKDGLDPDHPVDPAAGPMMRNELFIVVIEGKSRQGSGELGILTEMLPAGWRIEADNLRPDLAIAPGARAQLRLDDEERRVVLRREAQEDRLVALLDLERATQGFRLGFLVRAAHSGEFVWPGSIVAGVSDPALVGYTMASHISITPGN